MSKHADSLALTDPDHVDGVQTLVAPADAPRAALEEGAVELRRIIEAAPAAFARLAEHWKEELTQIQTSDELSKKRDALAERKKEIELAVEKASVLLINVEKRIAEAREAERRAAYDEAAEFVAATAKRGEELFTRFGQEMAAFKADYEEAGRMVAAVNRNLPPETKRVLGVEELRVVYPPAPVVVKKRPFNLFVDSDGCPRGEEGWAKARHLSNNLYEVAYGDRNVRLCTIVAMVEVITERFFPPRPDSLSTFFDVPAWRPDGFPSRKERLVRRASAGESDEAVVDEPAVAAE